MDAKRELLLVQARHGAGPLAGLESVADGHVEEEDSKETERVDEPCGAEEDESESLQQAGELTGDQFLCNCSSCGTSPIRCSWPDDATCPTCGAGDFAPVPIVAPSRDPVAQEDVTETPEEVEADHGPDLAEGRFGRLAYYAGWLSMADVQESLDAQTSARSRDCGKCSHKKALCPLVRCVECEHLCLYGLCGVGSVCPKCDSSKVVTLKRLDDTPKQVPPPFAAASAPAAQQ
jgi:hypothetical protein